MRTRRLGLLVAVMAMVMGVMAPAWAGAGGVSSTDLVAKGWNCELDNYLDGGAGVHCSQGWVGAFIAGGTGTLHLMVFSSPHDDSYPDEEFLGTELLRFSGNDIADKPCGKDTVWHDLAPGLYACHSWHGGFNPTG